MLLEGNTKLYEKALPPSLVIAILVCFLNNRFLWKRGGAVQITFYKGFDREPKTQAELKLKFSGISLNNKTKAIEISNFE